jgi:hypothetical protein
MRVRNGKDASGPAGGLAVWTAFRQCELCMAMRNLGADGVC